MTPTAELPVTPPTAELPPAAPTAMLVETAKLGEPTASLPNRPGPVTTLTAAAGTFASTAPVRTSRRWLAWVGGSALVVAVAGGYFGVRGLRTASTQMVPPQAAPVPPAATAPSKQAAIHIENAPPGLKVSVDGVAKELPIVLPGGDDIHTLLFEAPGYHATEFHVDGMRASRALVLAMKPIAHGTAAAAEADDAAASTGGVTAGGEVPTAKHAGSRKRPRRSADVITDR